MVRGMQIKTVRLLYLALVGSILLGYPASAAVMNSPSFNLDSDVANNFGGKISSTSYTMVNSGGEAVVGNGSSGSYKLAAGYIPQLEQSIQLNVQPSGQGLYLPLDEPVGTGAYDNSINQNNGLIANNPTRAAGKLGSSLTLVDTSSQYVSVPTAASLESNQGTVSIWFKSSSTNALQPIFSKAGVYMIYIASGGNLAVYDYNTSTSLPSSSVVNDGIWHYAALSYDLGVANGSKLYLDGNLVLTTTTALQVQTNPIRLGNDNGTNYLPGSIDEAKFFNRILTSDEIGVEYAAQNAGNASGLSLKTITPGVSNIVGSNANVLTDAPGYNLAFAQSGNLQNGADTISPVNNGGTIDTPAAWTEGTTKGLGFTLSAAPALPAKWGAGANYAALPGASTTFYSKSGYGAGSRDIITMQYRLDVPASQPTGNYQNTVTYTATMIP